MILQKTIYGENVFLRVLPDGTYSWTTDKSKADSISDSVADSYIAAHPNECLKRLSRITG